MSTYYDHAYHHAAIRAIGPLNPLSFIRSANGEWKRSAMTPTCVGPACKAARDSSLARSIVGGRDEKREVDSMAEDDGT